MTEERPPGDLGTKLREARERRGVSLRQIANTTKIAVAVLDGLERNDISKLPGGIFGRAFVRSFAAEVGLDPEASIQEFMLQFRDESVAVGHPASERIEDSEALERKRRLARTFLGLIAVGLLVATVITYFGFAGGGEQSLETARQTPAAVAAAAGAGPLAPQDAPATTVPSQQTVSDSASPLPAGAPERPATEVSFGDRITVTLTVNRPCWVSATLDGRQQIDRVLMPGDDRVLDVRNELAMTVGDAGAVTMSINGVQAKALGRSGEVVTARVNPSNAKTYLPPQ